MATEQGDTSSPTNVPALPNPARVITTTNLDTSIASFDKTFEESLAVTQNLGGTLLRLAYVSGQAPEALNEGNLSAYGGYLEKPPPLFTPGGGATVWYIDIPPGAGSPLHRTISLDFVTIIDGELQLMLDSGETRLMKPGDIIIQRGTMHRWTNLSTDRWARMVGILSESEPIVLNDGQKLGTAGLD
ncbi:putative cupin domain protein [Rosellinia necatrix]|uniref:Putative cupin domain protein n=1 Tax=Rosellinia necatrix TaxID=77044 RepID=A0A1W2TT46_ROSNE|nr:putative cupin domain protein [Rosellinia necatrix]